MVEGSRFGRGCGFYCCVCVCVCYFISNFTLRAEGKALGARLWLTERTLEGAPDTPTVVETRRGKLEVHAGMFPGWTARSRAEGRLGSSDR